MTIGHESHTDREHRDQHARRIAKGWWVFAAIALFYLLSEHRAHLFGILPYVLLLACPLMHVFMHGGHHDRHGAHGKDKRGENEK